MASPHRPSPFANPHGSAGLSAIKNIVAIASGKGGVGKSTISVNLAMALKQTGARVGLMDADIYGPSQPGMLGSRGDQPAYHENRLTPVKRHGIDFISMGLLVNEDTPVIWRAPMAMKMIQQFIGGVTWGELDYLLIDLPPGTGDVQLTLAQQAQLSGAVIVTTPQQVAIGVARKGLRMFEQVKVPILGIIENMSGFVCSHCGQTTHIFEEGGGRQMAKSVGVPFLGAIPLDPAIVASGETGIPVLLENAESIPAKAFQAVAEALVKSLSNVAGGGPIPDSVTVGTDQRLNISWSDGQVTAYEPHHLRTKCSCAACVDEDTGRKILDDARVPLDITITGINPVGRYGLALAFSDGHNTGIYTFERLHSELAAGTENENEFSV